MFTGIVERLGTIAEVVEEPPGRRLVIDAGEIAGRVELGASVAINGCCLTVVAIDGANLAFEAGPETLSRTNLGELVVGSQVNLEGSLRVGDQLGGHFVTGHVDAVGSLDARDDDTEWATLWFKFPEPLAVQMVSKGSIAVDGVSLTLVDVERDRFSVQLIPHSLSVTTLGALKAGGCVNLETDMLAKYAQKALGQS